MGSVGDCFDKAICKSFFATLECKLLDRRKFKAEARVACFELIEHWYNPSCRHSALGFKSPINSERNAAKGLESLSLSPSAKPRELHNPGLKLQRMDLLSSNLALTFDRGMHLNKCSEFL